MNIIQKAIGLILLSTPEFVPETAPANGKKCRRHGTFQAGGSFRIDSSMHYSLMARSYGSQFRVILLYRELKFAVVGSIEAMPLAFRI